MPEPPAGSELPLLLALSLGLLMGVQLFRVFLPLATFHLHDAGGLPPWLVAVISLAVLAVGLRSRAAARRAGWRAAVRGTAGLLALTRAVEQLSTRPAVDARVALVGTVLLALLLGLLLLAATRAAAQRAARADMALERASWFVLGGWLGGLLLVGILPLHVGGRWRAVEASALAAAGTWMAVFGGDDAWLGIVVGTPGMAVLLFDLIAGRSPVESRTIAPGAAGLVMLSLLYLTYGRFDQRFGPAEEVVYLAAIGLLVASCLAIARRGRTAPASPFWREWLGGLLFAAALTVAAFRLLAPPSASSAIETEGPIRIMTYNLHQGFDIDGRLDPAGLAEVIERESPDVLALQEVVRGWLVTGGLDLHGWMRRRLGLAGRFAGTADPQWGNALLSRLPIRAAVYHPLPPADLPLRRGVLDVRVGTRRGDLRFLCLHLHHAEADDAIRVRQVEALLDIWGGSPGTVLLGDFNAVAGSGAIRLLRDAGLHDASEMLASSGRGTTTSLDGRQIDWIFATTDLAFESTTMRYSRASDHLPVITTVHLTTRFRGAAEPSGAPASRRPPG